MFDPQIPVPPAIAELDPATRVLVERAIAEAAALSPGKKASSSRTVWAGVLAVVSGGLIALQQVGASPLVAILHALGVPVDQSLVEAILAILAALGGGAAVAGRLTATQRLV